MIFLYASIVNKHLQDSKFRHFYAHATCHTLLIPKYFAIENKSKEGSPFTTNPSYNNDCEKVDDRRIILMVRMKKKSNRCNRVPLDSSGMVISCSVGNRATARVIIH